MYCSRNFNILEILKSSILLTHSEVSVTMTARGKAVASTTKWDDTQKANGFQEGRKYHWVMMTVAPCSHAEICNNEWQYR